MNTHKITVVDINANDVAVFLDANKILAADKSAGDDLDVIFEVADNLSQAFGVEFEYVAYTKPNNKDWDWYGVACDLIDRGHLPPFEEDEDFSPN